MLKLWWISTAAIALVLSGCGKNPELIKVPNDYPTLTVSADESNTLLFTKPDMQLAKYSKVYIAPVKIQIIDNNEMAQSLDKEALALAGYADKVIHEELSKIMEIAPAPATDVLTMEFRITELKPTNMLQIAMMVPPFATINLVSPEGAFMGSITLTGQLFEGLAKEPSVAFATNRSRPGVDAISAFGKWTAAKVVLDNAAKRLAKDFSKLQKR